MPLTLGAVVIKGTVIRSKPAHFPLLDARYLPLAPRHPMNGYRLRVTFTLSGRNFLMQAGRDRFEAKALRSDNGC